MAELRKLAVNGERFEVEVLSRSRSEIRFRLDGREYFVEFESSVAPPARGAKIAGEAAVQQRAAATRGAAQGGEVRAALPGVIVDIATSLDSFVQAGDLLLRIEAMKMQNSVFAPSTGIVREIFVSVGAEVTDGQALLRIESSIEAKNV